MHEVPKGKITCIEKCVLRGTRPRYIGFNARIPVHGTQISGPGRQGAHGRRGVGPGVVSHWRDRSARAARQGDRRSLPTPRRLPTRGPQPRPSRCGIWWRG